MIKQTVFSLFLASNVFVCPVPQDTSKIFKQKQEIDKQINRLKAIEDSVKVANKKWEEIEKAIIEKNK